MKEKEIKKLVDEAVTLHREIAEKSEQFKNLKTRLVQEARLHPEDWSRPRAAANDGPPTGATAASPG